MGFFEGVASLYGIHQQNRNIDKQLSAQALENSKNRQYNLELAKMQNAWNIEQWNRENAYNSPAAQMERMRQAGLNPDMMYGGGVSGNLAASSPSMTSGAPSSPMDFTALGSKRTVGDAILQGLQIEQARANISKTEGEAKQLGMDNDVRKQMIDKGLILEEMQYDVLKEEWNKLYQQGRQLDYSNSIDELKHSFTQTYKDKIVENWLQKLETSTKLSANELKEDIETLALRIAGVNAENARLDRMSKFTTDEMRLVFDIIRTLLKP